MKKLLALLLTLAMILSLGLGVATADDAKEMTTLKILAPEWYPGYFAGRDTQVVWQEAEKLFHEAGISTSKSSSTATSTRPPFRPVWPPRMICPICSTAATPASPICWIWRTWASC